MGRTVPSFRMALEMEMAKWTGYRKCLRLDEREIFDRMMDDCRIHASASGMVVRTNPLEAMFMSVLLEHQRKIEVLEKSSTVTQFPRFNENCSNLRQLSDFLVQPLVFDIPIKEAIQALAIPICQ